MGNRDPHWRAGAPGLCLGLVVSFVPAQKGQK